ncbi:uncharacterized protein LOC127287711 [Leptopilina boulardi]|uniref:uncharacterized protein LOC127287711 n=1 Tax=Leptopilina boulardi TaxID=63433 RepID=UPI0021F697A9|nr:uncharacterized protein LOC127287711 [Leptopilina boulardi]
MRNSSEKEIVENVSAMQEIDQLMGGEVNLITSKEEFKYELRQWITAFGAIVGAILAGVTGGFSAILIPQLEFNSSFTDTNFFRENFNDIKIETISQKSWLGFSGALLLAPGCWLSGLMLEKLGRRMTHLVITPFYFLSWLTITRLHVQFILPRQQIHD